MLIGTHWLACLTEDLFQDNKKDVAYLLIAEDREAVISIIADGIKTYVEKFRKK